MAQFSVNTQRFDPYKNFKFRVKWDGKYVAGVSKVTGLKRTTEVVKHRDGGDPSSSRKSPGRTEYEAITLDRGVTHDTEFEKWANKVWNFGSALGSADGALTLLEAACAGGAEDPATFVLGERDARLLTLREWTFGPDIAALVSCPGCGASQELNFHAADIRVPLPQQGADVLSI